MTSLIYFVIYTIICLERVHTGSDLKQMHDNKETRFKGTQHDDNQQNMA